MYMLKIVGSACPILGSSVRTLWLAIDNYPDVLTRRDDNDRVVDYIACQSVFSQLELNAGKACETHVYEGTEHAFDNACLNGPIAHWYDSEKSADASGKVTIFLAKTAN